MCIYIHTGNNKFKCYLSDHEWRSYDVPSAVPQHSSIGTLKHAYKYIPYKCEGCFHDIDENHCEWSSDSSESSVKDVATLGI